MEAGRPAHRSVGPDSRERPRRSARGPRGEHAVREDRAYMVGAEGGLKWSGPQRGGRMVPNHESAVRVVPSSGVKRSRHGNGPAIRGCGVGPTPPDSTEWAQQVSVRWAFIGAGRHARLWMAPALAGAVGARAIGVWSQNEEHARAFSA